MNLSTLRAQRLEALHGLSIRLSGTPRDRPFAEALETLVVASPALGGSAFTTDPVLRSVAELGLGEGHDPHRRDLRRALGAIAQCAIHAGTAVLFADLGRDRQGIEDADQILELGARAAFALPVLLCGATVRGVFVLLFEDALCLDSETGQFAATIANLLAPALDPEPIAHADLPADDEFAEASHMASLGLLTASVAHELRGPAGAMLLQQEELARLVEQLTALAGTENQGLSGAIDELGELSADIQIAVSRVRDTVQQLSLVARRETSPECLDLAAVVRDSLVVVRPHLERRGITLTEQLDASCLTVGRRDSLGQVVLNLIFNACDACDQSSSPRVWVKLLAQGDQLLLVVEDNGPGVPRSAILHIFRAFYTTKERGRGTGLGLKICNDVVASHGGHIEVHERPGGGASFQVVLTRVAEDSSISPIPQARTQRLRPSSSPSRKVYLIDDDPVFSRTMRRALKPHVVRTAGAASDAEVDLLDLTYSPDLVLCDLFLPGRNGDTLHARIAEQRPELADRFVFVTGGALGGEQAQYLKTSACPTLFKPVELKTILELLQGDVPESAAPRSVRTLHPPSVSAASTSAPPAAPLSRR